MSWYYLKEMHAEESARLERALAPYKELVASVDNPEPPECARGDWANCLRCDKLDTEQCPQYVPQMKPPACSKYWTACVKCTKPECPLLGQKK